MYLVHSLELINQIMSNIVVINPVLGKNLEHLRLKRSCGDMGPVR